MNKKERYTISYSSPYYYLYDESENKLLVKSTDEKLVKAEKKIFENSVTLTDKPLEVENE